MMFKDVSIVYGYYSFPIQVTFISWLMFFFFFLSFLFGQIFTPDANDNVGELNKFCDLTRAIFSDCGSMCLFVAVYNVLD